MQFKRSIIIMGGNLTEGFKGKTFNSIENLMPRSLFHFYMPDLFRKRKFNSKYINNNCMYQRKTSIEWHWYLKVFDVLHGMEIKQIKTWPRLFIPLNKIHTCNNVKRITWILKRMVNYNNACSNLQLWRLCIK